MKLAASRAALVAATSLLAACGSGGSSNDGSSGGSGNTVTVSGRITFDRVPVGSTGLNFSAIAQAPARGIVVEAIDASSSSILASGTTNTNGQYSLVVPGNRNIRIRAKAQMTQSGSSATWSFRVLNNTNDNALYVLDSAAFATDSSSTRDLNAPSGWSGSAYTGTRAAAPFAILDTVYEAKELLLSAQPSAAFPDLDLYWSATNRSSDTFCPSAGNIGTTSFVTGGDRDECSTPQSVRPGIYVLGHISDSDEFDQHVIAHEFGHYVEAHFSRSDSIGGEHTSFNVPLDMRVAFSEGWGNAFSAMVLGNPLYRDSFGVDQLQSFNIEANGVGVNGWYSEASVMQILWDLFDGTVEPGVDNLQLPFASLFAALTGAQKTTPALTSIFSYANALLTVEPGQAAAIQLLLASEGVNSTDPFGVGETNFGAEGATMQNTVYASIMPGSSVNVCTSGQAGVYNKLNNRRFLKLDLSQSGSSTRSIVLQGAATSALHDPSGDPDIIVWRRGEVFATGFAFGTTETLASRQFPADVYILEVFDAGFGWPNGSTSTRPRCMNVTVN